MINHSPALENALKSSGYTLDYKVELLDKNEVLLDTITSDMIDGNISVDGNNDIKRNFSLVLLNKNNKYTPDISNSIWMNRKVKPYIGVKLPTGTEWIPQGVFLIRKPIASTGINQVPMVRMECPDKMDGWGSIRNQLTINTGLSIPQAIQIILDGIESKFNFEDCTETIPYDLTYNMGTERKQIVKDIVNMITWDIGYNVYGELRLKPKTDPENGVITWTYKHEDFTLYQGSEKEFDDSEFANVIITVGSSSKTATVSAIAEDNDLLSPFSTVNYGERIYFHNGGSPDPLIVDEVHAMSRSQFELRKRLQLAEKQRFTSIPNFLHDYGDVVELIEDGTNTNGKYELLRFNIPFGLENSSLSGECWKIRRLL